MLILTVILTSSNVDCLLSWWPPFDFHIWSAIPDFNVSLLDNRFSMFFHCYFYQAVSPFLYSLQQLHRIKYTQFMIMFSSECRGLVQERYLWRVELLNTVLMLHELQILWIFSDVLLTADRLGQIVVIDSSVPLHGSWCYACIEIVALLFSNANHLLLVCAWITTYEFGPML